MRVALHLYCGRIRVDVRSAPPQDAVILLASNHPNSFFDALVIATHLPYRMRFLARGDAFRDPRAAKVLRALFMIPIYRMSEGRAELKRTSDSFHHAHNDLAHGGSVLVFSEGLSVNEAGLRPLGKGTARIAFRAWEEGLNVQVLPVWLRYSTFRKPFMDVDITTGGILLKEAIAAQPEAAFLRQFNVTLRERLIALSEKAEIFHAARPSKQSDLQAVMRKSLLLLPALLALVLHAPWYFPLRAIIAWKTRDSVFFDSVLFGLLFLTYPIWLLVLVGIGAMAGLGYGAIAWVALAPLCLAALRGFNLR